MCQREREKIYGAGFLPDSDVLAVSVEMMAGPRRQWMEIAAAGPIIREISETAEALYYVSE